MAICVYIEFRSKVQFSACCIHSMQHMITILCVHRIVLTVIIQHVQIHNLVNILSCLVVAVSVCVHEYLSLYSIH